MKPIKLMATAGVVAAAAFAAQAQEQFITIGTGGQTGVYYIVGQSICKLVNRDTDLKCTAPSTGGSIANINALQQGDLDLAVAQSDWAHHAYEGTSEFEGNQFEGIRSVFSVHPEPFTVVARADAGIETFEDLKGKRVNVGNPGSGQLATMEVVLEKMGWTMDDFALASQLKPAEQAQALCDNKVDAIVYTVGHPAGSIQEATTACDSVLVDVDNDAIRSLVEENAYYSMATIPGGMYAGSDDETTTFGVRATFVSADSVESDTIYKVVKSVFENFDRFKGLHPAFEILTKEEMITQGLSAPLHEGAKKYYEEAGLM